MKTNLFLGMLVCCFLLFVSDMYSQNRDTRLLIRVKDRETNIYLQGVHIEVANVSFTTDKEGICTLANTFQNSDTIVVSHVGYEHYFLTMDNVKKMQPFIINLIKETTDLDEVIIRATGRSTSNTTVSQILKRDIIAANLGGNFANSLQQIKGLSAINTGITVAKPVIHGMHSNRILIVNNGVRQKGQQWGDDHAPELDMNTAESIKVLKGAESVKYGSEALGGVILLESKLLPYKRKEIKGNINTMYGSNGKRYAVSGFIDGTFSFSKNLAWRVQGTYINGGDRRTANYLLNNTGIQEKDFSIALGLKKDSYGIDVFYSRFDTRIGVLYSSQMGNVDLLKQRIALGRPLKTQPFSRNIDVPNQKVEHQLLRAKGFVSMGNLGSLKMQYSLQTDHRNEFHARRNNLSSVPSLSLDISDYQFSIKWKNSYAQYWQSEIGAFYEYTNNSNLAGTGVVPIIPNYIETNAGIFAIQKFNAQNYSFEAGVRFDKMVSNSKGIDAYSQAYGGERNFRNYTYNIGIKYHLSEDFSIVSNIGTAWRAPHVHELYSNGLEHASGTYSVGDSTLNSERSTKWINSISCGLDNLKISLDAYLQWVNNFIYDEPSKDYMTIISGVYPVFKYKQTNAFFRGLDADVSYKISKHFNYDMSVSMIWVNEKSTGKYLPFIPPLRVGQSVKYSFSMFKESREIFIRLKHRLVAKQNRFDPQTDLIGVSPPAYNLFGLDVGFDIINKKKYKLSVNVQAENIVNKEYKDYTNRFRYYAHDAGRDISVSVSLQF